MNKEQEKQKFIEIIEALTALIENNPGKKIKATMIEGIKEKTNSLKPVATQYLQPATEPSKELKYRFQKEYKGRLPGETEAEQITRQEESVKEAWDILHNEITKEKNKTPQWAKDLNKDLNPEPEYLEEENHEDKRGAAKEETKKKPTFIELYIKGEVEDKEVDNYIDDWHNNTIVPLHEFLGLSKEEYNIWLNNPSALPAIVKAREEKPEIISFGEYVERLSYGELKIKPMSQHYEDFLQS